MKTKLVLAILISSIASAPAFAKSSINMTEVLNETEGVQIQSSVSFKVTLKPAKKRHAKASRKVASVSKLNIF